MGIRDGRTPDGREDRPMDEADGRMLLRKRDLVDTLGVAKSTVADWVTEFRVFIPTMKDGSFTWYKPEALDVLNAIKVMREQNVPKAEIYARLQQKGFPVTVEEAGNDVQRAVGPLDARKKLWDVMHPVGHALERLANHDDAMDGLAGQQKSLGERHDGQDERVKALERTVQELKAELEKKRGPWWKFWR